MDIIQHLRNRASTLDATVVLPEGTDPRVIEAAGILARDGIVNPVLIGTIPEIQSAAAEAKLTIPPSVQLIEPGASEWLDDFANRLYELRKAKGMSLAEAREQIQAPLPFAAMMVQAGVADGCVAGAVHATSDVLRAGLQIIGVAEGTKIASSLFLMVMPDGRAFTFGDCGMVPYPDAGQLAQIAVASAQTHEQLTGETARVAMLSFSTKGSAKHESVSKVQEATKLARQMAPELAIDGELQFDAAYVDAIGQKKAPGSSVAGKANIFIFPNLDAGNIAYKITERLGGAQAIGPIIQGLARPIHDLSRGCKAEDIVTLSAISAIQS